MPIPCRRHRYRWTDLDRPVAPVSGQDKTGGTGAGACTIPCRRHRYRWTDLDACGSRRWTGKGRRNRSGCMPIPCRRHRNRWTDLDRHLTTRPRDHCQPVAPIGGQEKSGRTVTGAHAMTTTPGSVDRFRQVPDHTAEGCRQARQACPNIARLTKSGVNLSGGCCEFLASAGIFSRPARRPRKKCPIKWWPRTESNRRHGDFQSPALPTELLGHGGRRCGEPGSRRRRARITAALPRCVKARRGTRANPVAR